MSKESCLTIFPEIEMVTRKLSDEQFGILIRAVIAYRFRGEFYSGEDAALDIAFQFLASQVDRSEALKERNARAARARWNPESMQGNADAMRNDAPIRSDPVLSDPVRSDPVQNNTQKNIPSTKSNPGKGAAAPQTERKKSYGKFGWVKLEPREYEALKAELGEGELDRCITFLDEAAQSTGNKNRWKDFGLVIQRCSREGWGIQPYVKRQEPIPRGASGELGAAELEAIQTMLRQKEERL